MVYYVVVRPYDGTLFNSVEIMNEICLLFGSYLLIEFTDYESNAIFRYEVGWFLTGIMAFTTLANLVLLFYKVGQSIYPKVKSLFTKCGIIKV